MRQFCLAPSSASNIRQVESSRQSRKRLAQDWWLSASHLTETNDPTACASLCSVSPAMKLSKTRRGSPVGD